MSTESDRLAELLAEVRHAWRRDVEKGREAFARVDRLQSALKEAYEAHKRSECPTDSCTCSAYDATRSALAEAPSGPGELELLRAIAVAANNAVGLPLDGGDVDATIARLELMKAQLAAVDEILAMLPEYPTEEEELAGGPKPGRAQRIQALIWEADQNARLSVRAHARARALYEVLEDVGLELALANPVGNRALICRIDGALVGGKPGEGARQIEEALAAQPEDEGLTASDLIGGDS